MKLTIENLIKSKYREFVPDKVFNLSDRSFQKKIFDDEGVKYFIDVNYYNHESGPGGFEIRLQFSKMLNGIDVANNINIFAFSDYVAESGLSHYSSISIEDLEKYVDDLWIAGGFRYYEKY